MLNDMNLNEIKIIVDHRELKGRVVEELFKAGVQLDIRNLPVADYVLSDRLAIEFKTINDLESSIIDGRIFKQCEELIDNFQKPIIIVLGNLTSSRIHPNSLRGAIAAITIDYGIPLINFETPFDVAQQIIAYAKREQDKKREVRYFAKKKGYTENQILENIVASFPTIGIKLAKEILKQFKSIKNLSNAKLEELLKVPLIGPKKAKRIYDIINLKYNNEEKENK